MRKKVLSIITLISLISTCLVGCGSSDTASSDFPEFEIANGINTKNFSSTYDLAEGAIDSTYYYGDDSVVILEDYPEYEEDFNTEEYNTIKENSFEYVSTNPLSTFAADVDTGSYCNLRRMVLQDDCELEDIPSGAIRTEELLNYFDYEVENKSDGKFSVQYETNTCPWDTSSDLLLLTVEANEFDLSNNGNNFVFLIDTSGSMEDTNKLDLAINSFKLLAETLDEDDRVSIVTYAGDFDIVLDGCDGSNYKKICKALDKLKASGGTNGSGGIEGAYDCALDNFILGGNNRVIIASDGDMNLGDTSQSSLVDLIKEKKESGVFLTTLGFGQGNYSDANMEQIADAGNGNYFYIDCIEEAKRVLVNKMKQTTLTVAKDVKFQLEFNPNKVAEYRLLGYENRVMSAHDFEDDTKDGGEVGAGQQVTVLYEIKYADGSNGKKLKYQENVTKTNSDAIGTLSIRYKEPESDSSVLEEVEIVETSGNSSDDWKLAAGLAEFSMIVRDSDYIGTANIDEAYALVKLSGNDEYRAEFAEILEELGADNRSKYNDKDREIIIVEEPEQEPEKPSRTKDSNEVEINLGTLESTSYDSLFDLKVGYNNALKEVSKLGIEVQNQGLEENKNEEYIATVIIDTNDLDILLDTLIEYEFTECFVVE